MIVTAPATPGTEVIAEARIYAPDTGWTQSSQSCQTQTASGDAPVINDLTGSVTYTAGGSATAVDLGADATVSDVDDDHYNGGHLYVDYMSSFIATDQLTIASVGNITTVGNEVRYNGTAIGDIDGTHNGANGNNLKIVFDSDSATDEAVGALIHALRFSNSTVPAENTPMAQRSMDITLWDPAGNSSAASTVTVNVNTASAPVATAATNVTGVSFTANWEEPTPAPTSYRLDVATSSDFSTFVPGYEDLNVGDVTSYPVSGLTPGGTYYYRVRAVAGTTSGNSNTIEVTTSDTTPELSISKVDREDPWYVGWVLGYDITIRNTGDVTLTGVVVTDTIPSPWTYMLGPDYGLDQKVWQVGDIGVGEIVRLELEVQSLSHTPPGTVITNTLEGMAAELGASVIYTETTLLLEAPEATITPTATPTQTPTATPTPTSTPSPTPTATPSAVGDIEGAVWNDEDGDGVWDPGEIGLEGVGIELWAAQGGQGNLFAAGLREGPLRVTYTDSDGVYRFEDVPVGNYMVKELDLEGYVSTTSNEMPVTVLEGVTATMDFGDWSEGGNGIYLPLVFKIDSM